MDRRTLLALVLSALVIILWTSVFSPRGSRRGPQQSPEAPRSGETTVGAPGGESPLRPAGAGQVAGEVAGGESLEQRLGDAGQQVDDWDPAAEELVEVFTDLMVVQISTRGGGLASSKLPAFADGADREQPVDLVREGHQVLDLGLVWRDAAGSSTPRAISLGRVPFAVIEDHPLRAVGGSEGPGGRRVVLRARRSDGLTVTREYVFVDGSYQFGHTVRISMSDGASLPPEQLVLGWRAGLPQTEKKGKGFAERKTMNALALIGGEVQEWNPDSFEKHGREDVRGAVRWAAVRNKYFLAAIVPAEGTAIAVHVDGDESSHRNEIWVDVPLSSTGGWQASFDVYIGPSDYKRLSALGSELERAVRLGPRVIRPLGRLMMSIINGVHSVVPNYGLVIIIVSVMIRLVLHPLNRASMKSMKAMQEVQPEMKAIREKYANSPQEMNKRTMALYKNRGVNPVGGCLPVVLQMPFLFALYYVLMFSVDLRMAPFVGWINDLSAPDVIGRVGGFEIHVLPLVMTGISVLQAKSTPHDPRQKAMTTMMPVIFLFLFYSMPSGLVLYWTVMNGLAWAQQAMMNRGDSATKANAAEAAQAAAGGGAGNTPADGGQPTESNLRAEGAGGAAAGSGGEGADGGAAAPGDASASEKSSSEPGDDSSADSAAVLAAASRGGGGRHRRQQKRRKRR